MTVGMEVRAHGVEVNTARVDLEPAPNTAQVHLAGSEVALEQRDVTSEGTWYTRAFVPSLAAKAALARETTVTTGAKVVTAIGTHSSRHGH